MNSVGVWGRIDMFEKAVSEFVGAIPCEINKGVVSLDLLYIHYTVMLFVSIYIIFITI